jgi:1-acyl-sn-glycerol-3-phosphate acyltransferase
LSLPSHRALRLRAARIGRAARSGLLFSLFGVGAVLIAGLWFPLLSLLSGGRGSELRAQRAIRALFAAFVRLGSAIGSWRVTYSGVERLSHGPVLIVANHPTLMDVVFLISLLPQADCVVKRAAWKNPALSGMVRAAGYIPNTGGMSLIDECAARLQQGRNVVLFPEGSRSPLHGLGPIQRGAAHIALQSGCGIVPVVIDCQPPALKKGDAWYALPDQRLEYRIAVGSKVYAKDLVDAETSLVLSARHLSRWFREYFETELQHELA